MPNLKDGSTPNFLLKNLSLLLKRLSTLRLLRVDNLFKSSGWFQYDEAISRTGDVRFSLSFKHLEVGREWFQWDSTKCKKHRKVAFERNVVAEDYASESAQASESVQVDLINDLNCLSCNNLPFSIPVEVINEIKPELKELILKGKIQPSQNGKEYAVPLNHTNKPLIVKIQNNGLTVCKPLECLNYNLYSLCSHTVAVAQNTGNLGMIIEHAHKKARPVKLTSLANFGRPSGSGTKKGFKRIRNRKNI